MIFADNLVSTELGYIGNIWENTWVFNELIEENLKNFGDLLEEQTAKSIIWTKELFAIIALCNNDRLRILKNLSFQLLHDYLRCFWFRIFAVYINISLCLVDSSSLH